MRLVKDKQGRYVNPCTQINTSIFAMERNGTSISDSSKLTPAFMEDSDKPLQFFQVQDPLYYNDYDPFKMKAMRESEKHGEQSAQFAQNINSVINN